MSDTHPIHSLRETLDTTLLQEIHELASTSGNLRNDKLQRIAYLHAALEAVRYEIEEHEVKVGGGAERPLR